MTSMLTASSNSSSATELALDNETRGITAHAGSAVPVLTAAPADEETLRRMAVIRIWDSMVRGARSYVERHGFVGVHNAPELVGITGACENVDTLFKVDYFGQRAYLAQSDQLYLELITPYLKRVYAEIQSFRMEPEADARHLCQFSLFEIEHVGDLDELIGHLAGIVQSAATEVATRCTAELALFGRSPRDLMGLRFARITYQQAIDALSPQFPELAFGDDLTAVHEAALTEHFGPCFVTHYPLPIKFFNMKQNEDDERVVNSTDLLLPFAGESAGAAEREHDHDAIERRLKSSSMYERLIALGGKDEDFAWYLDAHKDKEIPLHSGAGIGLARVAQFILGVDDIRDAVPFVVNKENLL